MKKNTGLYWKGVKNSTCDFDNHHVTEIKISGLPLDQEGSPAQKIADRTP